MEAEKINVEFEVINYKGEKVFHTVDFVVPVFEDYQFTFQNDVINRTKEQQIDEFIEGIDKNDLMIANEWQIIINWSLKSRVEKMKDFIESVNEFDDKTEQRNNFVAMYAKLYPAINDLSFEKQAQILIHSIDATYMANLQILEWIMNLLKGDKNVIEQDTNRIS